MIYDHLTPRWGHATIILGRDENGRHRACIFQTPAPRTGDVVLLQSANQHHGDETPVVLQYRIVGDVRTPMDPGDQHFATLEFMEAETNAADGRDPR